MIATHSPSPATAPAGLATPAMLPRYALYGEEARGDAAELVHIEAIATRSRPRDWRIASHTHPGLFQVLVLLGGEVSASVNDVLRRQRGPVAITLHPSVAHGYVFSKDAHGYVLTLDQQVVFGAAQGQGDLYTPLFLRPQAIALASQPLLRQRLEALLDNLMLESAAPAYGQALMLEWLARGALLLLLRAHDARPTAERSGRDDFALFSRFRAELERRYMLQWQVGQYADALGVTPARLNRLCLKLTDRSAFELTQDRLMLEACRQLKHQPASIASIAYALGFEDPAYFSRLFKKRMALTPKQFRSGQAAGQQA